MDCWKGGRSDKKSADLSIASVTGHIGEGVCFLVMVKENRFCVPRLFYGCLRFAMRPPLPPQEEALLLLTRYV